MFKDIKNKIEMAALVAPIYAADGVNLMPKGSEWGGITGLTINSIISGAITLVLVVVSLVFFFILVTGGLRWVTSGGDEKKVGEARAQITNALIGLAIVFASWAIMKLIGTLFGVDIFNLKFQSFQ